MKTMILVLPFLSSVHGSMVRIVAESAEDLAAVRFDNEEANEWARISATGAQQLSTDADIVSGGISIRQVYEEVAELRLQNAELRSMMWPMLPPSVLDLTGTDSDLKGFVGGFTDGTYGYMVPYNGAYSGKVARFLLSDFSSVSVLDLTAMDSDLKGFVGGFTDGTYGYMVPHYNGANFGKVARFSLSDFSSVSVLDLTATDSDLKGFHGGFTDGTYGYLVPNTNGAPFGKVARFLLSDFSTVSVLDLTASDLEGFVGGFTDGTYGYMVPRYNGASFGKVARFLLSDFSTVSVLDLTATATDSDLKGFRGGFTDGTYGYMVPFQNFQNGAYFGKVARFSVVSHTQGIGWTSSP